jgi:glycerophosphoryl diester phosphodiesterase
MTRTSPRLSFFPDAEHPIQIVAHRGGSLEAPENTLYALSRAFSLGLMAEVDVGLSRDGRPMVLHDDTLLRTTGTGGRLEDLTEAELSALDAGSPEFSAEAAAALRRAGVAEVPRFSLGPQAGLHVPSLREALALPGGRFMLELKASAAPEALCAAVVAEIDRTGSQQRVAIASFDPQVLEHAERMAPQVPRIGVAESVAEAREMLRRPIDCLAVACAIAQPMWAATPPHVALWAWTAYTAQQAERLRTQGVHGVITDAPFAVAAASRGHQPRRLPR